MKAKILIIWKIYYRIWIYEKNEKNKWMILRYLLLIILYLFLQHYS